LLSDLIIENYQSLRRAKLRLGLFTVVTGPSSSGKSALFRAVEHAAFNTRGTGYISRGAAKCVVGVGSQDEGWAATITRGGRGADAYRISAADPGGGEPKVWEATKLAGKVPDEVPRLLKLTSLNFAGQFDPPFLLRESPGEVARILGQLTNVTLIFKASAEAARRKKNLAADLRAAETELARLREEKKRFAGLRERIAAAQQAEEALHAAQAHQARAASLQQALSRLGSAREALNQATVAVPQPPDLEPLETLLQRRARLQALLDECQNAFMNTGKASQEEARAGKGIAHAEEQISKELDAAGICPVCGQESTPALTGPFPSDGDYARFYRLMQEQPCKGNPDSAAHEYLEPLDSKEWMCVVCGTTGPFRSPE
jgi:hypothetical protein